MLEAIPDPIQVHLTCTYKIKPSQAPKDLGLTV